jgi:hypothetical protein
MDSFKDQRSKLEELIDGIGSPATCLFDILSSSDPLIYVNMQDHIMDFKKKRKKKRRPARFIDIK